MGTNDVLVFTHLDALLDPNGKKVAFAINGKHYSRKAKKGSFKVVLKDWNGNKPTIYEIKFNGITKVIKLR